MAKQRLTDRGAGVVLTLSDLVHVVDVDDPTDHPLGTSKKYSLAQIQTLIGSGVQPFINLVDGTTVSWDINSSNSAIVTLSGTPRTLAITNHANGVFGLIKVIQDGAGGRTLTLPANSKTVDGGGGALALSSGPGDIDILTFVYDGTDFLWNVGRNYT